MNNLQVRVYPRDVSSNIMVEDISDRHSRLKFSTRLHGGFNRASFKVVADLPKAWIWIKDRNLFRLKITDGQDVLWEGRIEDIEFDIGSVNVSAYGYYANLSDIPYTTAYNAHFDVILKALLTANCAQISADQSHIEATDITIDSAADESYLDKYPMELVEKLSQFSDSTGGRWYFAVWEDRIPYLFKRDSSSVNWRAQLLSNPSDFKRFRLKHRAGDLWNSAYAVYDAGGLTRTATATDADSVTKYGLTRRKVISNLGTVAAASAQAYRDGVVANNKDIWPRLTNIVLGDKVRDTQNQAVKSWRIRAGDVFRVNDLVPTTTSLTATQRDALRTFYIVETDYDVERGEMILIPDTENDSLSKIITKS